MVEEETGGAEGLMKRNFASPLLLFSCVGHACFSCTKLTLTMDNHGAEEREQGVISTTVLDLIVLLDHFVHRLTAFVSRITFLGLVSPVRGGGRYPLPHHVLLILVLRYELSMAWKSLLQRSIPLGRRNIHMHP